MRLEELRQRIIQTDSGCWEWTGARLTSGYGSVRIDGRTRVVHRVIWEALNGPVPDGLQMDHLCRNRLCCNPLHLEAVTQAENLRRGSGFGGLNAKKGCCPGGHPYDMTDARGYRDCSQCRQARRRRHYLRERAALLTGERPDQ